MIQGGGAQLPWWRRANIAPDKELRCCAQTAEKAPGKCTANIIKQAQGVGSGYPVFSCFARHAWLCSAVQLAWRVGGKAMMRSAGAGNFSFDARKAG